MFAKSALCFHEKHRLIHGLKKILLNVIPKQTGTIDVSQVTLRKKIFFMCLGLTQASLEFLGVHDPFFPKVTILGGERAVLKNTTKTQ